MTTEHPGHIKALDLMRVVFLLLLGVFFFGDRPAAPARAGEPDPPTVSLDAGQAHVTAASRLEAPSGEPPAGGLPFDALVPVQPRAVVVVSARAHTAAPAAGLAILDYAPSHSPPSRS